MLARIRRRIASAALSVGILYDVLPPDADDGKTCL